MFSYDDIMETFDINRVAIIGAGPCGLCVARHLHHNKYNNKKFHIVIFERRNQVGGLWVYDNINVDTSKKISPMYRDMITNLPKQVSYFPDFPFPDGSPSFLHHSLVLKYLQDYAENSGIQQFIRLETEVTKVSPLLSREDSNNPDNKFIKWKIESHCLNSGSFQTEEFDAVVICSGVNEKPVTPQIQGLEHFKGKVFHSYFFDDPAEFAEKSVCIYGFGPSALDITIILCKISRNIFISKRSEGYYRGNHPVNVKIVANISRVNNDSSIQLVDESKIHVDVLILCTGYTTSYPFLSSDCGVYFDDDGKVLMPIYKHLFNAKYPSMVFLSLVNFSTSFSMIYQQCNYVACIYAGHKALPSEDDMLKDILNEKNKNKLTGKPYCRFHFLGFDCYNYSNDLAEISETKQLPESIDLLFKQVVKNTCTDFYTAKIADYSAYY